MRALSIRGPAIVLLLLVWVTEALGGPMQQHFTCTENPERDTTPRLTCCVGPSVDTVGMAAVLTEGSDQASVGAPAGEAAALLLSHVLAPLYDDAAGLVDYLHPMVQSVPLRL